MESQQNILIIGGGLSGLYLAYLLEQAQMPYTLVEASSRFGGRIQTIKGEMDTPLELGATWFSEMHTELIQLLSELKIQKYPQFSEGKSLFQTKSFEPPQEFYVPASEAPSYRIHGGTETLIQSLVKALPSASLKLNHAATGISTEADGIEVSCANGNRLKGSKAVVCLPPQLVGSSIEFTPELPNELQELLPVVQTWMAGSIKFVLEYKRPFWREKGYSGMLFSHVGIVTEMYDHTNYEESKFGFSGFLNGSASGYSKQDRRDYVMQQLTQLLGPEAADAVSYEDKVWTDDLILGNNQIIPRPHYNNGHPLLQETYFKGRILFSGTETNLEFAGYMEGAIRAAQSVFQQLGENQ